MVSHHAFEGRVAGARARARDGTAVPEPGTRQRLALVTAVQDAHPDVGIWTAALDRGLDERAYIRPGLGYAGDRVFGTTG